MSNSRFSFPVPVNEPILAHAPGSAERKALKAQLQKDRNQKIEIAQWIDNQEVFSETRQDAVCPHDHQHVLGHTHIGSRSDVEKAIQSSLKARPAWASMKYEDRAAIFLKAADLMSSPYRAAMNSMTMLGQSKNVFQAEIDCVCEFVDFLRFNVHFMEQIYTDQQGINPATTWNRLEYRPLEGFVTAITPFNFTSIAGNLPTSMALMGNVVIWKPATTQSYSANLIFRILKEAGLPDGVINLVHTKGADFSDVTLGHPDFAGIHFTGSTGVFQGFWETIGKNIKGYKTYPRIVGETGGKDFVIAHPSSDPKALAVALLRGAFEYQGQKCSAASRAYIAESLWNEVFSYMTEDLKSITMGGVEDFSNFINAVIDKKAFERIESYIDYARNHKAARIVYGGKCDQSKGYFIEPTIILTTDPHFKTMEEEIFGPVLTIYLYKDNDWEGALRLVDQTSPYALTGAVFAQDRQALSLATAMLTNSAGNFYINDKPTGAVVGQQPFGGARASGTNDKAGSRLNLVRWVSVRTIKENFLPPKDYRYPFLAKD